MWIAISIFGLFVIWGIISQISNAFDEAKLYNELKPQLDNLKNAKDKFEKEKKETYDNIEKITRQRSMGFPWLAEAYADYFALQDGKVENYLRHKRHPAHSSAEVVRQVKEEKRELVKKNKIVEYKLHYLEKLFPWISELMTDSEDDELPVKIDGASREDNYEDSVKDFLTQEEYKNLPSVERNQKALDRYLKNRNRSKWAIGRDYEMYVGYIFSRNGYRVEFKGIIEGFEDLGRDVIATKDGEVCIVQCKNWAQYKVIHEKHIFQLFGTTMEYWVRHFKGSRKQKSFEEFSHMINEQKIRPIFYTSTSLSDKAKEMARALSVEIVDSVPLGEFPRIKCNVNIGEHGKEVKIYHLPMDQQYDSTIVGNRPGEFFAFTVKEAEDAGFRRAFKHRF